MKRRELNVSAIKDKVKALCHEANTVLRPDVLAAILEASRRESEGISKNMLLVLEENARIASKKKLAICQDTGFVTVFLGIGFGVVLDGDINGAVDSGVSEAYKEGFFRNSVVADPLLRGNTGTNTPCVKHIEFIPGDKIKIAVMPKGFGSENKSALKMFNPTDGADKIKDFCVEAVKLAGADACPPYVLGVGIGGTAEKCVFLAKKALLRPIDIRNKKDIYGKMEEEIKKACDALGIGIMGLGGKTTVLGVNIEEYATHIAGLPVAVNVSCHALRTESGEV